MRGIPRDLSREDGPYQDPEMLGRDADNEDEDVFGAWDNVEPTVASSLPTVAFWGSVPTGNPWKHFRWMVRNFGILLGQRLVLSACMQ